MTVLTGKPISFLKVTAAVLLLLVMGYNLLSAAVHASGLEDHLGLLPVAFLSVQSGSMEPDYSIGDVLVVYETPFADLAVGDDVVFHQGDELVTHRIVSRDGSMVTTRGLENRLADKPVGRESYCARVVGVVPSAGWLWDRLTHPRNAPRLAVMLVWLFTGWLILRPGRAILSDKPFTATAVWNRLVRGIRRQWFRLASLLAALSFLAVLPFVTAAKYVALIDAYTALSASSIHLAANYLSDTGNLYIIQGWPGEPYTILLRVMNYSNDLLYNREGQDLYYGVGVMPVESDGEVSYAPYGTDYLVTVEPLDDIAADGTGSHYEFPDNWRENTEDLTFRYGPYFLEGLDDQKQEHAFRVQVVSLAGQLQVNEKLRFKIALSTSRLSQFDQEIWGDFSFEVAEDLDFIGSTQLSQTQTVVTQLLKTNFISDGSATKQVRFSWNTEKLYLNEFESTAYYEIVNRPGNYNKVLGQLTVPLQAFSSVALQFFKTNPDYEISEEDITFTVIPKN